ncbi:MAG: aminofutalosine synthase MqnE, partial [Gaiellaceae bacterium]
MAVLDALDTLAPIREKIVAGERLDFEDGVALMESDDLLALGELADLARRVRGGGDEVYFVQNLYLNQTNVCRVKCKFCAFAMTRKEKDAYTLSVDDLVEDALQQRELAAFTEIHIVNGENPHVDLEFYADVLR